MKRLMRVVLDEQPVLSSTLTTPMLYDVLLSDRGHG